MAIQRCKASSCSVMAGPSGYCDKHKEYRSPKQEPKDRGQKVANPFYSSKRWRRVRKKKLSRQPLCEHCLCWGLITPAKIVDHRTPIDQGGEKFDLNNTQSLCVGCHNEKTAKDGRGDRFS